MQMSNGIVELRKKFKIIYDKLKDTKDTYVGYIQMSDKRIEHVYTKEQQLPPLDTLYVDSSGNESKVNYVLELALLSSAGKSILVRQHNTGWLELKEDLSDEQLKEADSFFIVTPHRFKMKIAQIWKDTPNEFCEGWDVLEPKYLMFAGFENA